MLDTSLCLVARQILGVDQHSNLASLEPSIYFHCKCLELCLCGFFHHSNLPCMGLILQGHILLALPEILLLHQNTSYQDRRHHNPKCCCHSLSALFVTSLQHYRFCRVMVLMQWCLKLAQLSSNAHFLEQPLPMPWRLHMICHKLQRSRCSILGHQAILLQNESRGLLRRRGNQNILCFPL